MPIFFLRHRALNGSKLICIYSHRANKALKAIVSTKLPL